MDVVPAVVVTFLLVVSIALLLLVGLNRPAYLRNFNVGFLAATKPAKAIEDQVNVRFFKTDVRNYTTFPEYDHVKHRPSVGICFSGGGSRSFEASLGYLRGLFDADLLKHIRYISSVSGGSWANAVFSYHDDAQVSLDELLGDYTPPEKLSLARLAFIRFKSARGFPVRSDLLATVATQLLVKEIVPDDVWVTAIHETFLKPAGISLGALPAWTRAQASSTLARNGHLLEDVEFRIPCDGKTDCQNIPFPIFNAAMLGPIEAAPFGLFRRQYVMMEATPMYVGFPRVQNVTYSGSHITTKLPLGGLVEPLGFGSRIADDADLCGTLSCPGTTMRSIPRPERVFSIANATAISSWAPAALVAEEPLLKPLENVLITTPYFSPHWGGKTRDLFVGDGANMENQGLIALLRRGVKSICMFINTPTPLADRETYHPYKRPPVGGEDLDGSFAALFGVTKLIPERGEDLSRDQVFRRIDFGRVADGLQVSQKRGKGAVTRLTLTTVENKWWGISAGRSVDVTFVYLGRVYEWESLLRDEVAQYLAPHRMKRKPQLLPTEGMFKDFPHFPVSKLHLNAPEANALADLTAWIVRNNLDIFRQTMSAAYRDE